MDEAVLSASGRDAPTSLPISATGPSKNLEFHPETLSEAQIAHHYTIAQHYYYHKAFAQDVEQSPLHRVDRNGPNQRAIPLDQHRVPRCSSERAKLEPTGHIALQPTDE